MEGAGAATPKPVMRPSAAIVDAAVGVDRRSARNARERRSPYRAAVACLLAFVSLTACSGLGTEQAATTTTTQPTADVTELTETTEVTSVTEAPQSESPPATEAPSQPDDNQTAMALMWSTTDFPAGWTSMPHHRSSDAKASADRLAACSGGVNVQAPVDIDAPDFTNGATLATLGIAIHSDASTVEADFAAIDGPKFPDCVRQELIRAMGPNAQNATVSVAKLPPPAGTPTSTVMLRARISQDGEVRAVSDIVLMGAGRTEVSLAFTVKGAEPLDELETNIVNATTARLAAHAT